MKCVSKIPRSIIPSKFACSKIKFKSSTCPLTHFYSLPMRLATHIKTGRCFWPSSHLWVPYDVCIQPFTIAFMHRWQGWPQGGVRIIHIYSYTHQAALGDVWVWVSPSRTPWQVDRGNPGSNHWLSGVYNCHKAIWSSRFNCCANRLWKRCVWDSSAGLRGAFVGYKRSWQVMTPLQSGSSWSCR